MKVVHLGYHDSTIETDAFALWLDHLRSYDMDSFEEVLSTTITAFVKWEQEPMDLGALNGSVQSLGLHSDCRATLVEAGLISSAKAKVAQEEVPSMPHPHVVPGQNNPSSAQTVRVWYIFIDVVGFTSQEPSMDDMVAIITALNAMVKRLLKKHGITKDVIILATGDGMCLGLLNSSAQVQTQLAFALRDAVDQWDEQQSNPKLRFQLRTALNIYDDYQIMDINGKPNLIGHGINTAARILNLGKPGEIVVSDYMYETIHMVGSFAGAFSPNMQVEIKGNPYKYRRIELSKDRRDWCQPKTSSISEKPTEAPGLGVPLNLGFDKLDLASSMLAMQKALDERTTLTAEIGEPFEPSSNTNNDALTSKVGVLDNEPIDDSLIIDNKLCYDAVQGMSWHPSAIEPKRKVILGQPTYPKEFTLRHPFLSFDAVVSPNSDSFKLVLKLMNPSGELPVHMVYGETSFVLFNDAGSEGMVLGYVEAGETRERPIPERGRPRFAVKLNVFPVRGNNQMAARLYINSKLVQTKLVLKEYTTRFGIVASGNGKPCHMTLSEMCVGTVAK